jgi:hypothetical protein
MQYHNSVYDCITCGSYITSHSYKIDNRHICGEDSSWGLLGCNTTSYCNTTWHHNPDDPTWIYIHNFWSWYIQILIVMLFTACNISSLSQLYSDFFQTFSHVLYLLYLDVINFNIQTIDICLYSHILWSSLAWESQWTHVVCRLTPPKISNLAMKEMQLHGQFYTIRQHRSHKNMMNVTKAIMQTTYVYIWETFRI